MTDISLRETFPALAKQYSLQLNIIEEFYQSFQSFDKNGDGAISYDELVQVVQFIGHDFCNINTGEITEMHSAADKNLDGLIQFDEFVALVAPCADQVSLDYPPIFRHANSNSLGDSSNTSASFSNTSDMVIGKGNQALNTNIQIPNIRNLFNVYDRNNDGYISREEIVTVMTSLGENVSDNDIDEMLLGHNQIDYDQFALIVAKLQENLTKCCDDNTTSSINNVSPPDQKINNIKLKDSSDKCLPSSCTLS